MLGLPYGAAAIGPIESFPPRFATGCPGRNGARCSATPIGPMPGPPPPCGMQKVLCRLRWHTSAPMSPGRQRSEEHTSELQSLAYLVCRLLLEKKKKKKKVRIKNKHTRTHKLRQDRSVVHIT